jgi:hypothetical protein
MRSRRYWRARLLTVTVLLLLAWGAGVIVRTWNHGPRVAYERLGLGDSRDQLHEMTGSPDFTATFFDSELNYFPTAVTVEVRYQGFYEDWSFTFDGNGKLIRKTHCFLGEYCQSVQ